jgi:hypothetical protein
VCRLYSISQTGCPLTRSSPLSPTQPSATLPDGQNSTSVTLGRRLRGISFYDDRRAEMCFFRPPAGHPAGALPGSGRTGSSLAVSDRRRNLAHTVRPLSREHPHYSGTGRQRGMRVAPQCAWAWRAACRLLSVGFAHWSAGLKQRHFAQLVRGFPPPLDSTGWRTATLHA